MSQVLSTAPAGHYRLKHVIRAEVTKLMSLPSTYITLGLTVLAGLLVTGLVTRAAVYQSGPPGVNLGFDPTQEALTGLIVAGLTAGVFGALLIAGEYSSGTIRTTLAATPRRPLLLTAKIGVTAAVTVVFSEVLSFAAFLLGQAVLAARGLPSASLGNATDLRAVLMTGLFISLLALMSFGFGLICRNTAGTIAAFVGVVFVLPLVMRGISQADVRFTPTYILTNSVMSTVNQGPGGILRPLSPTVGLVLMALYAGITLTAGSVLFLKRDA